MKVTYKVRDAVQDGNVFRVTTRVDLEDDSDGEVFNLEFISRFAAAQQIKSAIAAAATIRFAQPISALDVFLEISQLEFTHDGAQVVRNLPYGVNREPFRAGYRFTLVPNTINIWDIYLDPETMCGVEGTIQIMGGRIRVPPDVGDGDYTDGVVVDKDGVIPDIVDGTHGSLMEHYGLPVDGSAVMEVSHKFLKETTVPKGDPAGQGFNPGGNFELLGGLYLRIIYTSTTLLAPSGPIKLDFNFAK